ncbi:TetR/AcrR family transcriptional regulator [Streptomyces sp. CA-111067]|uniref:TetR/AcrR family transcriptional regulator n=1 Tax=Streptomyces sp. CA-111067 TaxID=3240046 RepID=UPI003D95888D
MSPHTPATGPAVPSTPGAPSSLSALSGAAPKPGLRERKKIQTRQTIRRAAYRLFAEHGYDATPVDRIAEAADVSPSTVFRYFPTKEDIVLTDEYDDAMAALLRARPADEPPLSALRAMMREALGRVLDDPAERDEMLQREELMRNVPAIRARSHESMSVTGRLLGSVLAERTGQPADSLEIRVFTATVFTALHETTSYWSEEGHEEQLLDLIDRSLTFISGGMKF